MDKGIVRIMIIIPVLLLIVVIIFSFEESKELIKQNESLILKNDSLHILQLKTKDELLVMRNQLDSLESRK